MATFMGWLGSRGLWWCYGLTLTALTLTASATKIYLGCTTTVKQCKDKQLQVFKELQAETQSNKVTCKIACTSAQQLITTKHDNQNSGTQNRWPYVRYWVLKLLDHIPENVLVQVTFQKREQYRLVLPKRKGQIWMRPERGQEKYKNQSRYVVTKKLIQ